MRQRPVRSGGSSRTDRTMWVVRSDEGGDGRTKMGTNPDSPALRVAPAWVGLGCKRCMRTKMKCMVGGAPQSVKWTRVATEEDVDPLQWGEEEPLFLESESEDGAKARTETAGLEIPGSVATELTEALRAQTMAMQGQACIEERLCTQME